MEILIDAKLKEACRPGTKAEPTRVPLVDNINLKGDLDSIRSPIQPCSLDLRIDEIFLPPQKKNRIRSWFQGNTPDDIVRKKTHILGTGESVRVSSKEKFNFDGQHCGILSAPARLTRKGIIVPDVGHIDPGFKDKVHLTLINVGKSTVSLNENDMVATVVIFKLDQPVGKPLEQRNDKPKPQTKWKDDIHYLSPDFLNIKQIAKREAHDALGQSGWKYAFFSVSVPILLGILVGYFTVVVGTYLTVDSKLNMLENKIQTLSNVQDVQKRLTEIELNLKQLSNQKPSDSQQPIPGEDKPPKADGDQ